MLTKEEILEIEKNTAEAVNDGEYFEVEVFHDPSDGYYIMEGEDRLHRGNPVAGFDSREMASVYIESKEISEKKK